jgi:hypothetical protein
MKKYVYYHLYLTDDVGAWSSYLLDNFKRMEDTKLLDELEKIYLVVVGNLNNIGLAYHLAKTLSDKYEVTAYANPMGEDHNLLLLNDTQSFPPQVTENVTIKKIYDHACKEDAYFLYNHSKGITSFERFLKTSQYETFINYYYWKEFLTWGVIDEWKNCIEAISEMDYDVAGTNYLDEPEPHYSGSFWWTKSSHIKELPDPITDEWWFDLQKNHWHDWFRTASVRFKDEMWVCSKKNTKTLNIKKIEAGSPYLYKAKAPKKLYA